MSVFVAHPDPILCVVACWQKMHSPKHLVFVLLSKLHVMVWSGEQHLLCTAHFEQLLCTIPRSVKRVVLAACAE